NTTHTLYPIPTHLSLYLYSYTHTSPTKIYTLSLHDALPIYKQHGFLYGYGEVFCQIPGRTLSRRRVSGGCCALEGGHGRSQDSSSRQSCSKLTELSAGVHCLRLI